MLLFVRKTVLEPARNLLRRPFAAQLARYCSPQGRVASQLATLRAQRPVPRRLVRRRRSIAIGAAVAAHLPATRRRRTIELRGDRAQRTAHRQSSRYLFAFDQAKRASRSLAIRRTDPARRRHHRKDRRRLPRKAAINRTHRLPALPIDPKSPPAGQPNNISADAASSLTLHLIIRMKCCDHRLNPPPKATLAADSNDTVDSRLQLS